MSHRAAALLIATVAASLALPAGAGAQAGTSYLIPPGNPFAGQAGAAPEIWALGFRNPYRFSFDRANGRLVIGDVGSSPPLGREEVNVIPPGQSGLNFGWPCREGTGPGPQSCEAPAAIDPVFSYPTMGSAITGGFVLRDGSIPALEGRYLYADFYEGDIRHIGLGADDPQDTSTGETVGSLSSFGEDSLGRVYATDLDDGNVFRLVSGDPVDLQDMGTFDAPVHVTAPPGDASRIFVVERGGSVRVILDGQPLAGTFLDISELVSTNSERGLLSLAFTPDYTQSGLLYVFYTDTEGDLRVDELRRSAEDPNRADPASRRSVLVVEHSAAGNHNGGQLQFGPDGYLYISTGDGGGQGDPERDGQSTASLLGKILRIDPDLTADTRPPHLRARVPRRQRLLRNRGVVAYARCDEPCEVTISGVVRNHDVAYQLRRSTRTVVTPGRRIRLRARLGIARRPLRISLRGGGRPDAVVILRARDAVGNRASLRRRVRFRR